MSTRVVDRNEADKILQGAVVLGCGGGGPLAFARKMINEMEGSAIIDSGRFLNESDWLVMIALIGSPSKVKERLTSETDSTEDGTGARERWKSAVSSVQNQTATNSRRQRDDKGKLQISLTRTNSRQRDENLFELVRKVQRLGFLSDVEDATDEVDGVSAVVSPVIPVRNTFNYLLSQCRMRATDSNNHPRFNGFQGFHYLLTGELGVVNIATTLYLSSLFDIKILDCDGAGRAVPFLDMITYANKLNISPSAVVSPQHVDVASVTMDLPRGKESLVEELLADLLVYPDGPFTPYVGYGTYVTRGHELRDVPVFDTYSKAISVGDALTTFSGEKRIEHIMKALESYRIRSKLLFRGRIVCNDLQDNSARDMGHLTIENDERCSIKLWYMNEFMMAIKSGINEPVAMAPDLIMLIPSTGPPADLSSLKQVGNSEVYILAAEASSKIKTAEIVESFEKVYASFRDEKDNPVYEGRYQQLTFV